MKIRFDEINAMADSLFLDNEEYFKAVPVDIFGLIKRLKIRLAEDDYGNDFREQQFVMEKKNNSYKF